MHPREELARDIIQYVMENDILTQHGMGGLRRRLALAIPDDMGLVYEAMLRRIGALMDAKPGTTEGRALDILAAACEAYEDEHFPMNGDVGSPAGSGS